MEDEKMKKITLKFSLLTGGTFTVSVENDISVDLLKKNVSKKLRIGKERICFIHSLMSSERELIEGTLKENGVFNGSKIIITPNVETGLAQRTENTVMQALESLNDVQVNDFLSGKSPLNLSVRLGDHMMLIQLQLSTLSPSQQNCLKQKVASASTLKQKAADDHPVIDNEHKKNLTQANVSQKRSIEFEHELGPQRQRMKTEEEVNARSPIKSLSSMVSTPLTTTVQNMNQQNNKFWVPPLDPISANLTSCLCKRLNMNCNNNCGVQSADAVNDAPCCAYNWKSGIISAAKDSLPFQQQRPSLIETSTMEENSARTEPKVEPLDNPALADASRNLTQTLKKLSKRVFTSKSHTVDASTLSTPSSSPNRNANNAQSVKTRSSAVIESMKHHGKGIYSGTFSGTLNPALQDHNGRPKRDISTIIHILNDLLNVSATPQSATRNGSKVLFEPTQSSTVPSGRITKIKKQPSEKKSCIKCVPNLLKSCRHGHPPESTATSNCSHFLPSTSTGIMRECCVECNHRQLTNHKLEIENLKTKNKLDHLKLVMQQKKERREARKLKITPPIFKHENIADAKNLPSSTPTQFPIISADVNLNESTIKNASSTTAITAAIPTNNSENHLEEVDTAA